ncbi:hypothetical protein BJX61DRAFT_541994 [Aspergillus egyptiacus]|nr:hypothetical protein BJX61DRAFT_541994 [Aspergillus egyptiacus]
MNLLSAYILDGTYYIFMSYYEGEPLQARWDRASESQRITSITNYGGYGPYDLEAAFNDGLVQALRDRLPKEPFEREEDKPDSRFWLGEYVLYLTVRELKGHGVDFAHGDLRPGIMVVGSDGTLVLLDWGLAGFWP